MTLRKKLNLKPGVKLLPAEQASDLLAKPKHDFDVAAMRGALGAAKNFEPNETSIQIIRELRGYDRSAL